MDGLPHDPISARRRIRKSIAAQFRQVEPTRRGRSVEHAPGSAWFMLASSLENDGARSYSRAGLSISYRAIYPTIKAQQAFSRTRSETGAA